MTEEQSIQKTLRGAYVSLNDLLSLRHRFSSFLEETSAQKTGNQSGIKLSKYNGRGIEFSEVRAYQVGDDIKSIDWRVTARKNKPHTKIFQEEREHPTIVAVDQTQNMFFGSVARLKSVAAAEVAARIAWQTLNLGDRVGGLVKSNTDCQLHRPRRSQKAVAKLLNSISLSNQALNRNSKNKEDSFLEGLINLNRLSRNRYRIYLISDFRGELSNWQEVISRISRSNLVSCIHITDPLESKLPQSGYYSVTDGTTRVQFFTGNKRTLHDYQSRFDQRCNQIADICAQQGVRYKKIETGEENLDLVRLY